jgi:hypothetical protein
MKLLRYGLLLTNEGGLQISSANRKSAKILDINNWLNLWEIPNKANI